MKTLGSMFILVGIFLVATSFFKSKPPRLDFNLEEELHDDNDDFQYLLNSLNKVKRAIGILVIIIGAAIVFYFIAF